MQFNIQTADLNRWFMTARTSSGEEDTEFSTWMKDMYPDCLYVKRFNNGDPFWEIRGGDTLAQSMILMRWDDRKTS